MNSRLMRDALMALAASASLCATPLANASTLVGDGYANGALGFTLTSTTVNPAVNPVGAGGFTGHWDGQQLLFWCFELTQTFGFGIPYTNDYVASLLGNSNVAALFQEVGGSAGAIATTQSSAAFQLALWEILYETSGTYNLRDGTFQAAGDAGALDLATSWLNALPSSSSYVITLLHSGDPGNHQDFVTDSRMPGLLVPEPSMLPLLGVGLLGMIVALRRPRNQAS